MKNLKYNLVLLAGCLFGPITYAQQIQWVDKNYAEWDILCNSRGTCYATGYQTEVADSLSASILLTREAGAQKSVQAKYALAAEYGEDLDENKLHNIHFYINNQDFGQIKIDPKLDHLSGLLSNSQRNALLNLVGKQVKIEFKNKHYTWTVSDQGMTAALLKMDDFQKRVGTVGALVKKGHANESQVLQASARPIVKKVATADHPYKTLERGTAAYQALRSRLLQNLAQYNEDDDIRCEMISDLDRNNESGSNIDLYALSNNKILVTTLCWRGAYNEGYGAWVMDQSLKGSAKFVTDSASDIDSGEILSAHKGRGLGDCWGGDRWAWDGKQFIHSSNWETGRCKGFIGGTWRLDLLDYEVK